MTMHVPHPPVDATATGGGAQPMRIGANIVLPDVLRDLGHDPAPVFAAAGIDLAAYTDAEATLPMQTMARLFKAALDMTGRHDIGLRVGARGGTDYLGLLLQRMAAEPDLRSMLAVMMKFAPINTRAAAMRLDTDDSEVRLEIAINDLFAEVASLYEEGMAVVIFLSIKRLVGDGWRPQAVEFAHRPTAPPDAYRQVFGLRPRFNRLRSAIVLRTADLSSRLSDTPGEERQAIDHAARAAASRLGLNIEDQTRAIIRANLARADLSLGVVARVLGQSSRTLNRRLQARGVSFASLLRDTRYATARHLLVDAETSLGEIATALGYADQTAFSRAFRLWSGTTPRAWRQAHGS
jgi:AraC-like DNA-binding protein